MEVARSSGTKGTTNQSKKPSKTSKEPAAMKVKYIADPVMVNAKDAREFKVIVQELTGKDSSHGSIIGRNPGSGRSTGTALVSGEHVHRQPELDYGYEMNLQAENYGTTLLAYDQDQLDNDFLSKCQFP